MDELCINVDKMISVSSLQAIIFSTNKEFIWKVKKKKRQQQQQKRNTNLNRRFKSVCAQQGVCSHSCLLYTFYMPIYASKTDEPFPFCRNICTWIYHVWTIVILGILWPIYLFYLYLRTSTSDLSSFTLLLLLTQNVSCG